MNELGIPRKPKILLWDLETSHIIGTFFQLFDDSTNYKNILQDWYIFCGAWKWYDEKKVHSVAVHDSPSFKPFKRFERHPKTDRNVVIEIHEALSKADAVIGHNGDRFDLKKFNARAIFHGLKPIPPIIQIDTLKIAKKHFKFTSNRLDYLGDYLGVGHKIKNDPGLWHECLMGDRKALDRMVKYNKRDVTLLQDVYEILKPYEPARVNHNLFALTDNNCPSCGSNNVIRQGFKRTRTTKYQKFQCQDCGAWSQKPVKGMAR